MEPAPEFNARSTARALVREARSGALATLATATGDPYCSLVNVATLSDGAPLLLLSRLALHTKNILADPRVSLMVDRSQEGDPLAGARVSLTGLASATTDVEARWRYLARHPDAEAFVDFGDFRFYRIDLKSAHLVAGFGRIVDLGPAEMLTDLSDAQDLVAAEPEILAHMNADHSDVVRLYATALLGAPDGAWRCVGCDPEGLDLQVGRAARRLDFPERVVSPGNLRAMLKALAGKARAAE